MTEQTALIAIAMVVATVWMFAARSCTLELYHLDNTLELKKVEMYGKSYKDPAK